MSSPSVTPPRWQRLVAVLVGAAILPVLAPPANWHLLAWVAYLPMFWAIREETPKENFRFSFLYGLVGVGLLFRWIVSTITVYSPIPWVGAVAILLLFSAVFGLQYAVLWPAIHPLRRAIGPWWVAVFPALEVTIEWLSMQIFLFPYNHGASQYRVPWTWQLVSVTGLWGLSYLLFLVNSALAEVMYRRREGGPFPARTVGVVAAAVIVVLGFGAVRYERLTAAIDAAPVLRVAQLQSDKDMVYRMSHSGRDAFEEWLDATRDLPRGQVDLVVWPEGACPYDLNEEANPGRPNVARNVLAAEARRGQFEMAVGGGTRMRVPDAEMGEDRVRMFNSVYWFREDGSVDGHYDKMQPLPFGEYLPFGEHFPNLARSLGIGDFRAGTVPVLFNGAHGRAATPICYEAILPGVCRLFRDADLFVVVTNDAWFGDSANPHQHAMLASVRATELGIPMVRSAYTGVSFTVDAAGRWSNETKPFEKVARIVPVHLAKFPTFYARFGDWFAGLCAAISVIGLARIRAASTPGGQS